MIRTPYPFITSCLLAVCLVQFGSAVQWHELGHLGERLAHIEASEHDSGQSDEGLHGLCKVCLALKAFDQASPTTPSASGASVRPVFKLTGATEQSYYQWRSLSARGPPHPIA